MPPHRLMMPLLLVVWLSTPAVQASSLSLALGVAAPGAAGGAVAASGRASLHDLRVGDDAFDVGVGWQSGGATAALSWRRTVAAGPVGTLVVDLRGGVDAEGAGGATGVRGTLGPVALRVEVEAGTRAPGPFAVLLRSPATTAPGADGARLTGAPRGGLRFDATAGAVWRPDRTWTWELTPRLHAGAGGWAGGAELSLRRAAVATDLDLSARVDLAYAPERAGPSSGGAPTGHAAVGLTVHHAPRRAPESRATLWWGGSRAAGRAPGFEVATVARAGGGQLTLAGGWGPAWADRPGAYAALALQAPLTAGSLHVGGRWVEGGAGAVEAGWTFAFGR